jgi:hypothetical protein
VVIERRALLRWQQPVPEELAEIGPLEGSFLELPGPRRRPARPKLEPVTSYGGALAARVLGGDGSPRPAVLLGGEVVTLTSAPLALSARDDGGCWALHDGQLVHHDTDGSALRALALDAIALVPAPGDGVWAVGTRDARRIDGGGAVADPLEWHGGLGSAPADGGLAAVTRDGLATLETAASDAQLDPHEQLLASAGGALVTRGGGGVRRRAGGQVEHVPLQAAGVADDGTPWVSGRAGPQTVELRLGTRVQRFDVPDHSPGVLRVVAVDGDVIIVAALDQAWRLRGGSVEEAFALDDDSYREQLFPHLWELTAVGATPAGDLLVGASGPAGLAVLSLAWPT